MSTPPPPRTRDQTRDLIWKMIKQKPKFQIFTMFEMFGKLSLSELSSKLQKSKSTILSHIDLLLELGIITKDRVPLKSNPNVFEHIYELTENYNEILANIDFEFKPFQKLTKEDIEKLIEPAISNTKILKSFYETQLHYYETIRDSGIDEEAIEAFNKNIMWVKGKDGQDVIISHRSTSYNFYIRFRN